MEEQEEEKEVLHNIRQSYDHIADEYARDLFAELDRKPLDQQLLTRFASEVHGKGEICDMGCGPGQVARFLRDAAISTVFGIDLSPGMLEQARRLNPDITFRQGNMLELDLPDASLVGITAFYSVINVPRESMPRAYREMARVLQPNGLLLLAHHVGEKTLHKAEMWKRTVSLDFHFLQPLEVKHDLEAAGLRVEDIIEREPYAPEVEHQSRRAYIFARKPSSP